ncbi:PqqD family protein, partial [uncultured Lutibacter sp.]|uniref:PqqD family protein n=1 Tax=uncultured Lutibacter sp. TaxID=437739 RepID=UPI002628615F
INKTMGKLNSLAISDNGFIFKPSTGESFTTNELGLIILSLLKEGKSADEIINEITEEFDVDAISAGRDLYEYLDFLKRENMID